MAYSQTFILCFLFYFVFAIEKSKVVDTSQGKVEGFLAANELYYEFCGIRYAILKGRYEVSVF